MSCIYLGPFLLYPSLPESKFSLFCYLWNLFSFPIHLIKSFFLLFLFLLVPLRSLVYFLLYESRCFPFSVSCDNTRWLNNHRKIIMDGHGYWERVSMVFGTGYNRPIWGILSPTSGKLVSFAFRIGTPNEGEEKMREREGEGKRGCRRLRAVEASMVHVAR